MDNLNNTPHSKLLNLSGKTAIVTGGALGIGFGIAYRLAEAGASVLIADTNEVEAQKSAQQLSDLGWICKALTIDVSNEQDVKNMVDTTVSEFSGIDILVNNAGIYPNITLDKMATADFEKVLDVNLKGVFLCTKFVSEQMIKKQLGGKIINITSIDALHPSAIGLSHYDASKHAVWGFTKNTALELAPHKIWVNAIAPGAILTPGVKNQTKPEEDMQKLMDNFLNKIPMHRMGEADEIGKVALFLASELSSYMTGSQIVVDGGALLS